MMIDSDFFIKVDILGTGEQDDIFRLSFIPCFYSNVYTCQLSQKYEGSTQVIDFGSKVGLPNFLNIQLADTLFFNL